MKYVWVYTHSESCSHLPILFSSRSKALSQFYKDMKEFRKLGWSDYKTDEEETTNHRYRTYRKNNEKTKYTETVTFGFERIRVE